MYDIDFCPSCGKDLPAGSGRCPACGRWPNAGRETGYTDDNRNTDRARLAAALILIQSVPLLALSLWIYFNAADFAATAYDTYPGLFSDYNYTAEQLIPYVEAVYLTAAAVAALGIVASVLAFRRRLWFITITLCIISTLFGITTLFGLFVGFVAFWMLWKAKPVFT